MKPLPLQDQRHLDAGQGWLGLGNWDEANEELEQITPELKAHHAVLFVVTRFMRRPRNGMALLKSLKPSYSSFQNGLKPGFRGPMQPGERLGVGLLRLKGFWSKQSQNSLRSI